MIKRRLLLMPRIRIFIKKGFPMPIYESRNSDCSAPLSLKSELPPHTILEKKVREKKEKVFSLLPCLPPSSIQHEVFMLVHSSRELAHRGLPMVWIKSALCGYP